MDAACDKQANEKNDDLTAEDEQEMDLFVQNSQNYCQKVYGKTFDEKEIDELRKEIKENNEAIKKIKSEWGMA